MNAIRFAAGTVSWSRSTHLAPSARDVRLGRYPIYIQGSDAEGSRKEIVVHHAIVSYTDPGRWKPSVKAGTIVYSPGHYLRTVKSLIGLNGTGLLPIGSIRQPLDEAFSASILTADVGYRSALGGIVNVGFHEPLSDGAAHVGGDVSEYTKRGIMFGPTAFWAAPDGSLDWHGFLHSGFIDDHGRRLIDVLDQQIPRMRAFLTAEHQQIYEDWTIDGQFNWWKDSSVTRDFRPKDFYPVQTPDNNFEVIHAGEDDFASLFARFRINNFEDVQERLPELRYELSPTTLGGGFVNRGSASAAILLERPPTQPVDVLGAPAFGSSLMSVPIGTTAAGSPTLAEDRLDVYDRISRPIALADWLNLTPVAGARVTDYFDTRGAVTSGHYLRVLGELGFDADARASGIFEYRNPTWDIDGLRHLISPQFSYRYIPGSETGDRHIPQIDRETFSTYLEPLELGDVRAVDALRPRNTLRLGLDNLLQTRDNGYGSRNLIDFDLADDVNFHRTVDLPDYSDLHSELVLTPARWIEIDAAHIVSPGFTLREFDAGLTLRDGEVWDMRIAGDFLRHEDDDYLLTFSRRINEQFRAVLDVEYGARQHILNFAQIGVVQILANTWRVDISCAATAASIAKAVTASTSS